MIDFAGVGVEIRGKRIIDDCSFRLEKHKITALLGRNGSGKTTLINCVNGTVRYTGEILLEGRSLALFGRRERARRIAILPQRLPNTQLSVKSLVSMGRNPYVDAVGRLNDHDWRIIAEAMEQAGVAAFAAEQVSSLSGGERQRAFLAMMLAQGTDVLIMDEPTTYLDVDAKRELIQMVRRLSRTGEKTMLIIMHDINDAVNIADNIALMDAGRCVFAGSRAQFLENRIAETHFGLKRFDFNENGEETIFFK